MPQVFFTRPGHKDLETLEPDVRERVVDKLQEIQAGSRSMAPAKRSMIASGMSRVRGAV